MRKELAHWLRDTLCTGLTYRFAMNRVRCKESGCNECWPRRKVKHVSRQTSDQKADCIVQKEVHQVEAKRMHAHGHVPSRREKYVSEPI